MGSGRKSKRAIRLAERRTRSEGMNISFKAGCWGDACRDRTTAQTSALTLGTVCMFTGRLIYSESQRTRPEKGMRAKESNELSKGLTSIIRTYGQCLQSWGEECASSPGKLGILIPRRDGVLGDTSVRGRVVDARGGQGSRWNKKIQSMKVYGHTKREEGERGQERAKANPLVTRRTKHLG